MDWETFWYIVLIAALVIALILVFAWYLHLRKKKKAMPSHIQLYFDENFRKIMSEWDMVTRDRVKDFKKDINARLSKVGDDIGHLEDSRKKLDKRLSALDSQITKMEGL
jgi:hypothetical protein